MRIADTLNLIEILILAVATIFAGVQLRALRLQNSADLTLRLSQELDSGVNQKLADALDSDPATPILKRKRPKGGGPFFTVIELDEVLGNYEMLDDFLPKRPHHVPHDV